MAKVDSKVRIKGDCMGLLLNLNCALNEIIDRQQTFYEMFSDKTCLRFVKNYE